MIDDKPIREALQDIHNARGRGPAEMDEALEEMAGQIDHLVSQIKAQDPLGVWQIELANGTVHNFVASRAMGSFLSVPVLLEFVTDLPSGRSPVVLAVRSDLVVSYRRLGDLGREEGQVQPSTFASVPFAGPIQRAAPKSPPMSPFATS